MTTLTPKPGFPWHALRWDAADAPQRDNCSLCEDAIPDEAVPLRMWNERGDAIVFCDACAAKWFGLHSFESEDVTDALDDLEVGPSKDEQ